jgi:hypothetical protein
MDGMNKKSLKIKIRNCARANPYGCREDCPGGIICGNGHCYGSGAEISLFNYLFQLTISGTSMLILSLPGYVMIQAHY